MVDGPVLVTGSEGYIGSNLIERLEEEGIDYRRFDLELGNDVRNLDDLEDKTDGVEVIYHLAACSGVDECRDQPVEAFETNVMGTKNVLEMGPKVVLASSFAARNPVTIYGLTKLGAEKLVTDHNGVALRFSNVYGGSNFLEEKNTVVANFVRAKLNDEKAVIYGDGKQTRDFIHVDDVVDAILKAPEYFGIHNICTGTQTSILELADMVGVDYDHKSARESDVRHSGGRPSGIGGCEYDLGEWINDTINNSQKGGD